MFKSKKLCLDCKKPFIFSKGLCKFCWQIKFSKPIKKVSEKQAEKNAEYKIIRDQFVKDNPICQANINNNKTKCTKETTQVHHMAGRIEYRLINIEDFLACCFNCHNYIELHVEEAKQLGFSKNRL
jgi:hypothetical protein